MESIATINNLINFELFLKENEKSKATVEKYLRDVKVFIRFLDGRVPSRAEVLAFKESLKDSYAVRSANSMIASLNSFLRFLGESNLCVKQFKVQREAYCSEKKELSKAEYLSLIKTAEQKKNLRISLVVQTICGTGIRVSELKFITVEALKKGEALVNLKGKTRKVFIVGALCRKLLDFAKRQGILSGAVFVTKSGASLDRTAIWRQMKSLCVEAGVDPEKVFPHNLRHLFARQFYGIEKDIAKLADILGHSNINTTRIYIVSSGSEHKKRLESMHLII